MAWMKKNRGLLIAMAVLLVMLAATVTVFVVQDRETAGIYATSSPDGTLLASETPSPEPLTYTEITFLSAGDIMYHRPQILAAKIGSGYDFTNNMKYVKPFIEKADFAAANFETTLTGPEIGYEAKQYPHFNAPDATVDSLLYAGFDLLFLANNHCYDYDRPGLLRTIEILDQKGMDHIGTRGLEDSKSYKIVTVQAISIGLLNYTLEMGSDESTVRINGSSVAPEDVPLIDTFNEEKPEAFYAELQERMEDLKAEGADLIIVYLHWGEEYELTPNETQKGIAQKLCDMGVDVLLASHPHVIQPVETFLSSDGSRKMPCFYSMGNYISNQNRETLTSANAEYTENGLMPILTIRKYSNGIACVAKLDYIATWVHRHGTYEIIPIEAALNDPEGYGLTDSSFGLTHAAEAKEMTDSLVKAGVDQYNADWQDPYPEAKAS